MHRDQGHTQEGYKRIYTPKLPCIVPQRKIILTALISYDWLKLYTKIYTPKNEILGTPLTETINKNYESLC